MAWNREFGKNGSTFFVVLAVTAVAAIVVVLFSNTKGPSQEPTAAVEVKPPAKPATAAGSAGKLSPAKEVTWIRVNKELLMAQLRDPGSAQFSDVRVSYKAGGPVVCGLVNAKNAFGGYTGSRRFIGAGQTMGVFLDGESDDFPALWNMLC